MKEKHHLYKKDKSIITHLGDELYPSEIKAGGVYVVQFILKDKLAEKLECSKYQWGIIMLDHTGKVYRSWNVKKYKDWSAEGCKIGATWHLFEAPEIAVQFADISCDVDTMSFHYDALKQKMQEDNNARYQYDKHWLRRFANSIINIFGL